MKNILILTRADLSKYSRAIKQLKFLREKYHITAVGTKPNGLEHNFISYNKVNILSRILRLALLKFGFYGIYFWDESNRSILRQLMQNEFDLIIAHSYKTLPLAVMLSKNKSKIIFDEHEYAPEEYEERLVWRFFFKQYIIKTIKSFLPKINSIITVSDGIAERYKKNFDVDSIVITNSVNYLNIKPTPVLEEIKLIYHGSASPGRSIELNIELMDYLPDNYSLDLMLVKVKGFSRYFNKIEKLTKKNNRVNLIPTVKFDQIEKFCNKYDIGLFLLPPTNFSLQHALPNKFFQYIQSRLVIAIGPSPEMAKIVLENNIGVVSDDFLPKSLAKKIEQLKPGEIELFKYNSDKAALKYSFENEIYKFEKIISGLNI